MRNTAPYQIHHPIIQGQIIPIVLPEPMQLVEFVVGTEFAHLVMEKEANTLIPAAIQVTILKVGLIAHHAEAMESVITAMEQEDNNIYNKEIEIIE